MQYMLLIATSEAVEAAMDKTNWAKSLPPMALTPMP